MIILSTLHVHKHIYTICSLCSIHEPFSTLETPVQRPTFKKISNFLVLQSIAHCDNNNNNNSPAYQKWLYLGNMFWSSEMPLPTSRLTIGPILTGYFVRKEVGTPNDPIHHWDVPYDAWKDYFWLGWNCLLWEWVSNWNKKSKTNNIILKMTIFIINKEFI